MKGIQEDAGEDPAPQLSNARISTKYSITVWPKDLVYKGSTDPLLRAEYNHRL